MADQGIRNRREILMQRGAQKLAPSIGIQFDLFGLTLFGSAGRNWIVGLDDYWSGVAAVRTPVHCPSVSAHPENNILRMTLRTEPLCYSWVDQETVPSVVLWRTASYVDERKVEFGWPQLVSELV